MTLGRVTPLRIGQYPRTVAALWARMDDDRRLRGGVADHCTNCGQPWSTLESYFDEIPLGGVRVIRIVRVESVCGCFCLETDVLKGDEG